MAFVTTGLFTTVLYVVLAPVRVWGELRNRRRWRRVARSEDLEPLGETGLVASRDGWVLSGEVPVLKIEHWVNGQWALRRCTRYGDVWLTPTQTFWTREQALAEASRWPRSGTSASAA